MEFVTKLPVATIIPMPLRAELIGAGVAKDHKAIDKIRAKIMKRCRAVPVQGCRSGARGGGDSSMSEAIPFDPFPKMARLSREIVISEKLDGTNAQVCITEGGQILAGSRTCWITPQDDNYGFAAWVEAHRDELLALGPGRHFGEWWGKGIQRNYGLSERRFSLFNVGRWCLHGDSRMKITSVDPRVVTVQEVLPPCCGLVPVLYRGAFDTDEIEGAIDGLRRLGSVAAPGFMDPEGVIVFHTAAGIGFKKTLDKDHLPKGLA